MAAVAAQMDFSELLEPRDSGIGQGEPAALRRDNVFRARRTARLLSQKGPTGYADEFPGPGRLHQGPAAERLRYGPSAGAAEQEVCRAAVRADHGDDRRALRVSGG